MIQPNQYGTEDIQNELLDLMKRFHEFCDKNGIQYYLYGGSCLGAIRHKGFIPWDDDLDICVDRENFKKLMSCFDKCEGLNIHQTIWIQRIQKNGATAIRGYVPTLDVLIIDNAPDDEFTFKIKNFRLAMLQGMLKEEVVYKGFSIINKAFLFGTHVLGKLFSKKTLRRWYDNTAQIGNDKDTKKVHCTNTSYKWIKNKYPASTWKKAILADFEDTKFYIPENYDSYLTICYGDYMKLPDEKHRKPEHTEESKK